MPASRSKKNSGFLNGGSLCVNVYVSVSIIVLCAFTLAHFLLVVCLFYPILVCFLLSCLFSKGREEERM